MLMQFFVAHPKSSDLFEDQEEVDEQDEQEAYLFAQDSSVYEYRLSRIALEYAKGWLILDLLSSAPSAFDIYSAIAMPAPTAAELAASALLEVPDGGSNNVAILRVSRLPSPSIAFHHLPSPPISFRLPPSPSTSFHQVSRTAKLARVVRVARILKVFRILRM